MKKEEKETKKNETKELQGQSLNNEGAKPEESSSEQQELQIVKEKLSQVENQYLRTLADYQNLQKRTTQEKEELYKFAAQKTIEYILPAIDTFEYARSTIQADAKPEKVIEDFNLVFEMLLKCLKDLGLETIEETGIPFDPVYHEPLNQIQTNELPNHTVMQILKKGYMLHKKVIRPALVSVSIQKQEEEPPEPIGSA